jgi:hypothetical protein
MIYVYDKTNYSDNQVEEFYQPNEENKMNGLFTFKASDFFRAVIVAIASAVLSYLGNLTDLVNLDWNQIGVVALIAALGTLVTALGTTTRGNFAGAVPVE